MLIRPARVEDDEAVWWVIGPTIKAGETNALPPDMDRDAALAYWRGPGHAVFVAEREGGIVGTYFLCANQLGGGAHVANAGYITLPAARGQGIARAMAEHSLDEARARGFRAMQFNLVVSTNEHAVRLWRSLGFEIVGTLPEAFRHPGLGYVDAFVMMRRL